MSSSIYYTFKLRLFLQIINAKGGGGVSHLKIKSLYLRRILITSTKNIKYLKII